jgi:hypothetical protein
MDVAHSFVRQPGSTRRKKKKENIEVLLLPSLGKTLFTGAMWQPFVPAQAAAREKARMEAFSASSVYGMA